MKEDGQSTEELTEKAAAKDSGQFYEEIGPELPTDGDETTSETDASQDQTGT